MLEKFEKEYEINYHDVAWNLKASISTIVNLLCDIGFRQSQSLGSGIKDMMEDKQSWVFYKYDIEVYRYPDIEEKIKVITEPIGFRKFYAYRKYIVLDSEGNVIIEGKSIFFFIDLERRRAIRIPEEQYKLYGVKEDLKYSVDIEDIKPLKEYEFDKTFRVRYGDIDSNLHVNNVKYIEWAVESLPIEVIKSRTIRRIIVNFLKETTFGHEITSSSSINNNNSAIETSHKISDEEGKVLATVKCIWD
ncbi:acyl-[acyl-carrier-protein] thioesterase [Clostridium manihotivorum]|uniref:Acyl-[acyl-carrier-protein] thioesterase n=1 Tax=Clostridium manihotivorum TaxID=2320868 RepID=A0A410DMZ0_9CLOT|nr:acyl-ACP thioesterase domain-containing protein [Clostridium manihotivorum]QAA30438.1 acyl-[acyl-carrier-protein] thioesterase [Clostridium manihotivorum]